MGNTYQLPRGTTWSTSVLITQGGQPVSLLGFRVICTVRSAIVDGTVDTGALAPVWQGDSAGSGVTLAIPSSTLLWSAGLAVTTSSYVVPVGGNGYFYQCTSVGSGTTGATASTWPVPASSENPTFGQVSEPDANGVVWTCAGQVNKASLLMAPSFTQALPNPTAGSGVPLPYDIIVYDTSGDIFQSEIGIIRLTSRVTLSDVPGPAPAPVLPYVRVTATGATGSQASPYIALAWQIVVVDTSLGSVVVNIAGLAAGQYVTVKHDENTSLASATVTVNGPSSPSAVNLAQPPPNNNPGNPGGGFVPSIVFGGAGGGVFAGESARGMGGKWMNVGSGGGYVLVS